MKNYVGRMLAANGAASLLTTARECALRCDHESLQTNYILKLAMAYAALGVYIRWSNR